MASQQLERALDSARRALTALTAEDTGAFEELFLVEHENDCRALGGLSAAATPADRQALNELIALDSRIASAIGESLGDTAGRLVALRRGGRTNAAYAASGRFA
jgi:hypothetical protein